jgi:DNA polymerase-3 subunit gamma/tau
MPTEPLAIKYRPSSFEDMIGQKLTAVVLQNMVKAEDVPPALLFSGPSGTGKTTAARILAYSLHQQESDVIEIDAASNGGVADVRTLLQGLAYGAKTVVYDECHSITRDGWNALLKALEENVSSTFVFVTTDPGRIPDTVLSRLMEFEFYRVSPGEIAHRLLHVVKQEGFSTPNPVLAYIAKNSGGNVRTALTSLDQAVRAKVETLDAFTRLRGVSDRGPTMFQALDSGDYARIYTELDDWLLSTANPMEIVSAVVGVASDLLVLRAGGSLQLAGESLQARKDLALSIDPERLLPVMKIVWDLKTRIKASDDPGGNVLLALTLISDVLTRGRDQQYVPPTPAPTTGQAEQQPEQRMSLADLQRS